MNHKPNKITKKLGLSFWGYLRQMYPTLVRRPIDMSDIKKIYWGCRPLPLKEWPAGLKDEEQLAIVISAHYL